MNENNKAVKIIKSLTNLVGVTAGIILASIGTIMFLNAIFNLYVFDIKTSEYGYDTSFKCAPFDVDRIEAIQLTGSTDGASPAILLEKPITQEQAQKVAKLTDAEKDKLREQHKKCTDKEKKENESQFIRSEKRHIATGLAFMLVGFPLIFFYQKRKMYL